MSRERYVFRGCLLLLPIVLFIAMALLYLINGELPDILNRVGILLEMVGLLALAPDIIGEKRLEKLISNVQGYKKTQKYIKEYLNKPKGTPTQETPPFLVAIELSGNILMSLLLIISATSLIFSKIQGNWIGIVLLLSFGFLGIESATWIILLILFLSFRSLVHKMPKLFSYFLATNSLISSLGVLISSALAFSINSVIPLLIFIAKIPLRKLLATITLPFIAFGALLQLLATFF